jgi:hypothetical protein
MPTLLRFTVTLAILAALGYGAMFALAMLVEPRTRQITVPVPLDGALPPPERAP